MTRPKKNTGFNRAARKDRAGNDDKPMPAGLTGDNLSPRQKGYVRDHSAITDPATGRTRLMDAVIAGDGDLALRLIRSGAALNATDKLGRTALHHAAALGQAAMIDLLLVRGIDPNLQTAAQETALVLLLEKQVNLPLVPRLLAGGADANLANKKGVLPLHLAAQHATAGPLLASLEALVLATRDPNQRDGTGATALHYAARGAQTAALELLMFHRLDVFAADNEANTCLHDAARHANPAGAQFLLYDWAIEILNSVNHESRTPLHYAVESGHVELVQAMLALGAMPNRYDRNGMTPLHLAVRKGSTPMVRALMDHGADINAGDGKGGQTPLMVAIHENRRDLLTLLLQMGASPDRGNDDGLTPLMMAASRGQVLTLDVLLENGANAALTDKQGRNVLHYTDNRLTHKQVERLIFAGADIEAKNRWGRTPLLEALSDENMSYALCLLRLGAKATVADDQGRTPLHHAVQTRRADVTAELINKGADINAKDRENGWTPMHYAVLAANLSEVRRLLAHKASPIAPDNHGRTPLHLAVNGLDGAEYVVRHLVDLGVDVLTKDNQGATPVDYAHSYRRDLILRIFRAHLQKRGVSYQPRQINTYPWPPYGR